MLDSMRFLHTSDWQIGEPFRFVDDETLAVLRAERLEAIGRIGRLAVDYQAPVVLVAGDIFDGAHPSLDTLLRPIERMRQFPQVEWHLIPGNHDAHSANSPWERLLLQPIPANVVIHVAPEPRAALGGAAWILPAILTHRHMSTDPTEAMDAMITPPGALRIGLAHGSVRSFGSSEHSTNNLLSLDRVQRAKLDYLALGDWHGTQQIDDRSWYSGTPEPDGFNVGGSGGGQILLVELTSGSLPQVTPLASGKFLWLSESVTLSSAEDISALEARIRGFHSDLSRVLLQLRVEGTLDLSARELFESSIQTGLGSALRYLRLEADRLLAKPSMADLEAMDHVGFVRVAADRLAALAQDNSNPEQELAAEALQKLYILHMRQGTGAQ
jgi:DNA repair exonuclease SbcCD nuclease subunit